MRGASLIECLVAILIFSVGVLGIVGLQARSIADVGENNTRVAAAMLGGQMIARIRVEPTAASTFALNASGISGTCVAGTNASSNAAVTDWITQTGAALPGAAALAQQIVVGTNGMVTVTLCWKSPREARVHHFVMRGLVS